MTPQNSENGRLNVIIVIVLAIIALATLAVSAYIFHVTRQTSSNLDMVIGAIVGGLTAFLSHQVGSAGSGSSSQVDAPNATTVNVSQPAAPNVPIPVPVVVEEAEETKP